MKIGRLLILLCFSGILFSAANCGKKAPPALPIRQVLPGISDVRGEWKKGAIILKGNIGPFKGSEQSREQINGVRVYYGSYPIEDPPCEGCPVEYQGCLEFGPEVIKEGAFTCKAPAEERGRIYFFEINLIGPGAVGKTSERLRIVVK